MTNPVECLPINTKVTVKNKIGTVIHSELVQAHPCGLIASHTIKFTHEIVNSIGQTKKVVALKKHKIDKTNYAFINVYNG